MGGQATLQRAATQAKSKQRGSTSRGHSNDVRKGQRSGRASAALEVIPAL